MEAMGARSNPCTADPLARLSGLHSRLLAGSQTPPELQPSRRKPQPVLKTILRVLETAEGPMHARDIHAAAEELLCAPVAWSSLKDCLSTHSQGVQPRFRRVRRGWYRLASGSRRS